MSHPYKLRTDNKTGIPGVHKFVYRKRKPGVKKRVQIKCRHVCISTDYEEAVQRRYEEEVKEGMYKDCPEKSPAYQWLQKELKKVLTFQ